MRGFSRRTACCGLGRWLLHVASLGYARSVCAGSTSHISWCFYCAAGPLPKSNNITWRGNSGLTDGNWTGGISGYPDLVGGYYDAGDNIKFGFPQSFAMTMLSWSVIEYRGKYIAAGELDHIRQLIKWGTDYMLKTFNSTAAPGEVHELFVQVRSGRTWQSFCCCTVIWCCCAH